MPSFRSWHFNFSSRSPISPRTTSLQNLRPALHRNMSKFTQEPHKLLVIPGPIEVTDEVLYANAHPSMSHMSADFAKVFGDCIRMTREVLYTTEGQPFLISGSGTLGWDQVSANLVEPGESALVLNSGYFSDAFADCLQVYGAKVDQVRAPVGGAVNLEDVESALKAKKYKIVTVTHVDTSTAVLTSIKDVAAVVKRVSPETLVAVDGVCSAASEEIKFDDWGIDVLLTASQKGLGAPPGLSILVASPRAIKAFETRSVPVTSYYGSWKKWLPIMQTYEKNAAGYFATPPVNLVYAYHASLNQILHGSVSLSERFARQREVSRRVKAEAEKLGYRGVPLSADVAANGMTALYVPEGLKPTDIVPRLLKKGIVVAGGLHPAIKEKYFRVGHMGISVVDPSRGDIDKVIAGLKESLDEAKAEKA